MPATIRVAERRDAEPIRDIFYEVYGGNSPFGSFFSYNCLILIAEDEGRIVSAVSVVLSELSPLRPAYEGAWLAVTHDRTDQDITELHHQFKELALMFELPDPDETARRIDKVFSDLRMEMAIIKLLKDLTIFHGLSDVEVKHLSKLFKQKLFRKDEAVFEIGSSNDELYVIMRGKIGVYIDKEGTRTKVATLGAGDTFGEIAFLNQLPRTATTIAEDNSILLIIQRLHFDRIIGTEPHLGMIVFRNLALDLSRKLMNVNESLKS